MAPLQYDDLYPYCLKGVMKAKVWGGRNLERLLAKPLPNQELIGETWEAWEGCVIGNGADEGKTLNHLIERDPTAVLGRAAGDRRFPLLFKFIDAQDDLSVQVHPDDAEAVELEHQPFGKTEAWYILHAEPGARLILGFDRDVTPKQVTASIEDKTLTKLMASVPVQPGDALFVPAGTVHAIGKGIVLAEIQENSDITYRLYDWGRDSQERPLHIAQSLRVLDFERLTEPKIPSVVLHQEQFDRHFLVACRYFVLELLDVHNPRPEFRLNDRFHILSVIEGGVRIAYGRGLRRDVVGTKGQTVLVPAGLIAYGLSPMGADGKVLRMYVPDLRQDVIEPLAAAGYDAATIAKLGGPVPKHNDLLPLLDTPAG